MQQRQTGVIFVFNYRLLAVSKLLSETVDAAGALCDVVAVFCVD